MNYSISGISTQLFMTHFLSCFYFQIHIKIFQFDNSFITDIAFILLTYILCHHLVFAYHSEDLKIFKEFSIAVLNCFEIS